MESNLDLDIQFAGYVLSFGNSHMMLLISLQVCSGVVWIIWGNDSH